MVAVVVGCNEKWAYQQSFVEFTVVVITVMPIYAVTEQNDQITACMDARLFRLGIAHLHNLLRVVIYYAVM